MNVVQLHPLPSRLPEPYVTRRELAATFAISDSTIDRMVREGCPCVTMGKRIKRFRISDVEAWMEKAA